MTLSVRAPAYPQVHNFTILLAYLVLAGLATFRFSASHSHSHCLPVVRSSHMRLFLPGKFLSQIFPWLFSILVYTYVQTHHIVCIKYMQFIVFQLYTNKLVKINESVLKLPLQKYFISFFSLIFLQYFSISLPTHFTHILHINL